MDSINAFLVVQTAFNCVVMVILVRLMRERK